MVQEALKCIINFADKLKETCSFSAQLGESNDDPSTLKKANISLNEAVQAIVSVSKDLKKEGIIGESFGSKMVTEGSKKREICDNNEQPSKKFKSANEAIKEWETLGDFEKAVVDELHRRRHIYEVDDGNTNCIDLDVLVGSILDAELNYMDRNKLSIMIVESLIARERSNRKLTDKFECSTCRRPYEKDPVELIQALTEKDERILEIKEQNETNHFETDKEQDFTTNSACEKLDHNGINSTMRESPKISKSLKQIGCPNANQFKEGNMKLQVEKDGRKQSGTDNGCVQISGDVGIMGNFQDNSECRVADITANNAVQRQDVQINYVDGNNTSINTDQGMKYLSPRNPDIPLNPPTTGYEVNEQSEANCGSQVRNNIQHLPTQQIERINNVSNTEPQFLRQQFQNPPSTCCISNDPMGNKLVYDKNGQVIGSQGVYMENGLNDQQHYQTRIGSTTYQPTIQGPMPNIQQLQGIILANNMPSQARYINAQGGMMQVQVPNTGQGTVHSVHAGQGSNMENKLSSQGGSPMIEGPNDHFPIGGKGNIVISCIWNGSDKFPT